MFNDDKNNLFIVCKQEKTKTGKISRLYKSFKDYTSFLESEKYFEKHDKYYYEIITERNFEHGFKIYFDIDSKENITEEILFNFTNHLEDCILKQTDNIDFDIIIYSSCYKDKFSYHIVVDKLKVTDMKLLKEFCEYVKNNFNDSTFKQGIDMVVYKPTQQFRLLYSRKINTSKHRTKKIYKKKTEKCILDDFEKSLLTNVKNCVEVTFKNDFEVVTKVKQRTQIEVDLEDIPEKEFIEEYLEENPYYDIISIKEMENDLNKENNVYFIILRRIEESYCESCDRIHESENPFIGIFKETVKFFCRRGSSGNIIKNRENNCVINIINEKEKISVMKKKKNKKIEKNETIF